MLNMKKGLAIVLAAATALTFAPVSTLGLQGVVEAQAADVTTLADWTTAGTANVNNGDTLTVDSTKDGNNQTFKLHVKNDGANALTNLAVNTNSIAGLTATVPTEAKTLAKDAEADITFTVAANAAKKTSTAVTVTSTVSGGSSYTYTFNLVITNAKKEADEAAAFAAAAEKISGVDSNVYIQRSTGSSVTIKPSYVTENGRENNASNYKFTVQNTISDLSEVTTVPVADLTLTGGAGKVNIDSASTGSVKLTVDKSAQLDATKTASAYLVAYKLNSSNGNYTPVAYNSITINPYAVESDLVLSDKYNSGVSVIIDKKTPSSILDNAEVYDRTTGKKVTNLSSATASIAFSNKAIASIDNNGYLEGKMLGSEDATITAAYKDASNVTFIATKTLRVNVISNSSSVIKVTADGSKDAANLGTSDAPIRLNVKTNKTFDLSKYVYVSDPANTTIAYKSDNNKNTVSDAGVVNATAAVDQFIVTVQAKDKKTGIVLASTDVYFRVNALPDDVLAVSGGSIAVGATVLSDTDYKYTSSSSVMPTPTEDKLAASQIHYVQLDVTGKETDDIQKDLKVTSANGAKLTYEIVYNKGTTFKDISQAGVLTIAAQPTTPAVAVIKVVSSATANSEVTTSYFYVVLDKADPNIDSMFESAYKLGTDAGAVKQKGYESDIDFSMPGYTVNSRYLTKSNDDKTAAQNLYNLDSADSFRQTIRDVNMTPDGTVGIANAEGKTEHVLVSVTDGRGGTAYKVITITSVPGVHNSVTKIEDATNNKTVYTPDMGTAIPELILDGNTTLKVTIKYSIDKNGTTSDINSTSLYSGADPLNQNIITCAKEKPKKGDTYNTFYLYPTSQGTQKVTVHPHDDISASDHSITYDDDVTLVLTYRANTKPSKVTGLKVANKKGAKVSVSFDAASNHNMKYWVQKKIGKKVAGKSVASNKATLSVKKGATVKVRVKAYYYDNEGNKHVGAYSAWKTLKTDKK